MRVKPACLMLCGLFCLFTSESFASSDQISIARIKGPVRLDGLSDEPAWTGIQVLSFVQMEPNFGADPTERTEVLIAHDDDYLYLAGRLFDREPEKILSNSKQRDSMNPACEWFGLAIDSFNDKENALAFFTTPSGLRWDATVFNDASGDPPINPSWNTFWDVAVSRNGEGWFAEFRIPFSSLRFQDDEGRVVMGIIVWRKICRKNELVIFPRIPPDWGFWSRFKPSRAQEFVIEGVSSRKPFTVAPYALGGLGRSRTPLENGGGLARTDTFDREAGLDVKYGLSNNLTLDVTANPDFAQVEADDQQVNMTRFSLFFPEKRLFFQERSSIFDFTFETSDRNSLFYSRRIGLDDEGRRVRIFGGARVIGRIGPYDLGFIDMQTASTAGSPSENFGVLRMRRQVFNENSYLGGMFTSRIGSDGTTNVACGLDGILRIYGDNYLTLRWAQSYTTGQPSGLISAASSRYYLNWARRSRRGLGSAVSLSGSGADFNPGIGFQLRNDFTRLAWGIWYGWYPGESSALFSHRPGLFGTLVLGNEDGSVENLILKPRWEMTLKTGLQFEISPRFSRERIPEAFLLPGRIEIASGTYDDYWLDLILKTSRGDSLYSDFSLKAGTLYGGRHLSLGVKPRWSVIPDLELSLDYELNRLTFPGRNLKSTTHIARLRALYMMSVKLSAMAFVQVNSDIDALNANIRIRYNPREGVDFYLVYNEALSMRRNAVQPPLPPAENRAVLLKMTYTFNFI